MTSLVVRVNVGPDSGFDPFMPTEVYTLHLFVDMSGSTKRTVHTDQGSTQEWRIWDKGPIQGHCCSITVLVHHLISTFSDIRIEFRGLVPLLLGPH